MHTWKGSDDCSACPSLSMCSDGKAKEGRKLHPALLSTSMEKLRQGADHPALPHAYIEKGKRRRAHIPALPCAFDRKAKPESRTASSLSI